MTDDPHGTQAIPVGMPVTAFDGSSLGAVREVYPHYLLVGHKSQHTDLEVPVHAILGVEDGALRVSVNRGAVTEVDDEETAHRMGGEVE